MQVYETGLDGVVTFIPKAFGDNRGFFMESYNKGRWNGLGLKFDLVQDNHSLSVDAGTLRGLHFQTDPRAQTKIVRVLRGAILDVVVDIRKGSPTYAKYISEILTADNKKNIVVPKGFAHGIITLVPNTEMLYKVDEFYSLENDRSILWSDPEIGIKWPFENPILSDKDKNAPLLKDSDNNFVYGE